jgi:glycosyltransferase involved in cell wall biosynthesis
MLGNNPVERHILALVESKNRLSYPPEVYAKLRYDDQKNYGDLARLINKSKFDIVNLQHEFGIFGGENGSYILDLVRALEKPLVTTFHTVLSNPGAARRSVVSEISSRSKFVVVMAEAARERLRQVYGINPSKIKVIPHGVPDFTLDQEEEAKRRLGLEGKFIVSTFGLIGASKGIEYVIESLPSVVEKTPNLVFLVIGKTHPNVRKSDGENYRLFLKNLVLKLGLYDNVIFINQYLTFDQIKEYLQASDIYITPYLEPEQIISGTLSYAVGAGKACVSTPYAYAKEILGKGTGILVPFRDSGSIGEALLYLSSNERFRLKMAEAAFKRGRKMVWKNVGKEYYQLLKRAAGK